MSSAQDTEDVLRAKAEVAVNQRYKKGMMPVFTQSFGAALSDGKISEALKLFTQTAGNRYGGNIYTDYHQSDDDYQTEPSPYQLEWDDLVTAIRKDQPYNEAKRGAIASLVTSMGRMAAHTGQVITYEDMLDCPHEFPPDVDKLTMDSPAPFLADANGRYPVPEPGIKRKTEY